MKFLSLFLITLFISTSLVVASPRPIQSRHMIDLRDFTGISYLQTMIYEEEGVADTFDFEYTETYNFGDWKAINYAIDNFDEKNKKRVLRTFNNDRRLLRKFSEALRSEEKTFTPENISDKVGRVLNQFGIKGDKYGLGHFFGIASGAGTLIIIDEDNYFYNFGYFAPEVRSGRSYGATSLHNANDASHLMYLRQLENFLTYENDYKLFFTGLMKFLVDTDISIYDNPGFNKYAEAVFTDYITVYTAELRRHLMRDLKPWSAPWGNDMTEATFLSFFNVKSGLMNLDEGLVESSIKEHWALSKSGSGRSGFGINRKPRRKLQAAISNFFRNHLDEKKQAVAKRIDSLIGSKRDGDIYRGVMEYFNNKKNLTDSIRVESIESEIVEAFVDFLMAVNENIDEIVETIEL